MTKWLKDLFLGKEHTEDFQIGHHVAIITDEYDKVFRVTRTGNVRLSPFGPHLVNSWTLMQNYLRTDKQILIDDRGELFPVCKIKSIVVEYTSKWETVTWRE